MRLILLVPVFPRRSETFNVAKFVGLSDRGHDVHVVCGTRDDEEWSAHNALRGRSDLRSRVHEGPAPSLTGVRSVIRHRGGLRTAAPSHRRRVLDTVIADLEPDLIHAEFLSLLPGREDLGTRLNAGLTASVRGFEMAQVALDDPQHFTSTFASLDGLHVLSRALWQRCLERGAPPGLHHEVIPPAVASSDRPTIRVARSAEDPLHLVSVGRLHWVKAHEDTLLALRLLLDDGWEARLRIIGDGPDLEAIAFARHQLGLDDHVDLVGALEPAAIESELHRADIYVAASVSEGFGNAPLEAQAAGLPVVATDALGLPENVRDGETGIIVPRRRPDALAEAIATISGDPNLAARMGTAGRHRAAEFPPEEQITAFEQFFADVLAQR